MRTTVIMTGAFVWLAGCAMPGPAGEDDLGDDDPVNNDSNNDSNNDPAEACGAGNPNALAQSLLFDPVCAGDEVLSSPARIRRIEKREWTRRAGKPIRKRNNVGDPFARQNPFDAPAHLPYSTYSEGVSIDPATLDIYFTVLDEAGELWTLPSDGPSQGISHPRLGQSDIGCMYASDPVSESW